MDSPKQKNLKRVTFKKTCENRNIKAVLKVLHSKLVGKEHKTALKVEQALASISKYPLPLHSGADCQILQGFDKNLCRFIDERLFKKISKPAFHVEDAPNTTLSKDNAPKTLSDYFEAPNEQCKDLEVYLKGTNKKECSKNAGLSYEVETFVDNIMLVLHHNERKNPLAPSLDMEELIMAIGQLCSHNITETRFQKVIENRRKYIKSRLYQGIVYYSLTDTGRDLVEYMHRLTIKPKALPKVTEFIGPSEPNERMPMLLYHEHRTMPVKFEPSSILMNPLTATDMPAGSYDVVMLVDKNEPEMILDQSDKAESRSLKVGDVIWVVRNRITKHELVLPFVVERKRMDDLAASIKDGRFHEQKFRLRKCGLRNVFYLIEDYQGNKHCGLPISTLNQARINTCIENGFMVHRTKSMKGTKRFLDRVTTRLTNELKGVHLRGTNGKPLDTEFMSFEYFNFMASKTKPLTVREMFIKMLVQLKGLTVEKALAITEKYSSPVALMYAYDDCKDDSEAELLLSNLKYKNTPPVKPNISKVVNMLFDKPF